MSFLTKVLREATDAEVRMLRLMLAEDRQREINTERAVISKGHPASVSARSIYETVDLNIPLELR